MKVLVVDDSLLYRRVLRELFEGLGCVSAVETAGDGAEALARARSWGPDLLTLDIDLPGMSGLRVLRELRAAGCAAPVIVVSSLTERGTEVAALALELGAAAVVAKPQGGGPEALSRLEGQLRPVTEALSKARRPAAPPGKGAAARPGSRLPAAILRPRVVAIGASTGGPAALSALVSRLPGDLPVPVVVALHLPHGFTKPLAEQLARRTALGVVEAADGMMARAGVVYVAPGGSQTRLAAGPIVGSALLSVFDGPAEAACRPSADVLFDSVAEVHGGHAVGVVLTGMGRDGVAGLRRMKEKGALVVVQDEPSSVVFGMPAAVIAAGLADLIAPPEGIADHLIAFTQRRA